MTTPQADYQRFTMPQWLLVRRLFSRNPLVRSSDRAEALVLVLAVVVSLLTAPIAAAVGTAVYDSRSRLYAEQAQNWHSVTATVIDDRAAVKPSSKTMAVRARWFAAGTEHTGVITTRQSVKPGDAIEIWVNHDGSQVSPPVKSAVDEAVAAALAIWWSVAIAATGVFVGTRAILNRVRHARWQQDFDSLVGVSDDNTSQP